MDHTGNFTDQYQQILGELGEGVRLVAVSKTKPAADIRSLYELGQRDFGENYVQELTEKQGQLPADIRWHFIGHLQTNKVKYIAPFVHLIHGVDSLKLLKEIHRQGLRHARVMACLLQVHIAREETKFGLDAAELKEVMDEIRESPGEFGGVEVKGLMGMASFSDDHELVGAEFRQLKGLFDLYFDRKGILSMGMSADYALAVAAGSNMVRIGSLLFGKRG